MYTLYADWRSLDPEDDDEMERMMEAHRRYDDYLKAERSRFPEAAFGYASAEWRNNFSDHRAPHDSWVMDFRIRDGFDVQRKKRHSVSASLKLLGAYHDGYLILKYKGMTAAQVTLVDIGRSPLEVYRDEVRLTDRGRVLHEIEFLGSENWIIECKDIEWKWRPFSGPDG